MVALKEIILRTGLSDTDAKAYKEMAEDRLRLYLAYKEDEDMAAFSSVIADVACLLHDKAEAVATAQKQWLQTAGMESKQYTEGPVSVRETYANYTGGASATVSKAYDEQINQTLQTVSRYRRVRVVKC